MLWLAAIRDVGGRAYGSSNQRASAHCRAQSWRLGDMYLDCVYSAGISYRPERSGLATLE